MAIARAALATGLLIFAIAAMAAPAAAGGANSKWSSACRHDAFTYCRWQAIEYNVPGVRDCLIRNLDRVSEACRGVIKAAQSQNQTPATPASH